MRRWQCVTKYGFILASGIELDNTEVYVTYIADRNITKIKVENIHNMFQALIQIVPTAHRVEYLSHDQESLSSTTSKRVLPSDVRIYVDDGIDCND